MMISASLFCLLCAGAIVAHAQNYSSCEPLEQYVDEHPGCYVYRSYYYDDYDMCYGMRCSGSGPNGSNITYLYTSFSVQRCQDPVTVSTYAYILWNGRYHYFSYTFDQSETVDDLDYYYYYYYDYNNNDTSYTAILDRNASHLGFELSLEFLDEFETLWLFEPLIIPLFPHNCMCNSMESVASEIHYRANYDCTVNDDCDEIHCTVRHSTLQSVDFIFNSCDHPPSVDVKLHMDSGTVTVHANDNTTQRVESLDVDIIIDLWHFDYSMDVQVIAVSGIVPEVIIPKERVILDLTACDSHHINISENSTAPTEITEPTVSNTSATMCEALKAISIKDGSFCSVDKACDALECEVGDHRLEMAVGYCQHPPGIRVELYDGTNHPVFHVGLYSGSHRVHDKNLPFDLNVTIQQLSDAIQVEITRTSDNLQMPIVPRTVIPIDNFSCFRPTDVPSTTCAAMQYIDSALAQSREHIPCYFPIEKNCNILTCPVNADFDMTIQLLPCAHVRLTGGSGFTTYFNHTFDDSEVVSVGDRKYIVTLTHPTPNQIGFAVSNTTDTIIPYTIIPVNTTGCQSPDSSPTPTDSSDSNGGVSTGVIASAVTVPIVLLLLILLLIVVIIGSVYLVRRRHRKMFFRRIAMSEVDNDEDQCT